jgi:hypothetical protein
MGQNSYLHAQARKFLRQMIDYNGLLRLQFRQHHDQKSAEKE